MYELPPRALGSEREQLAALRDYLVRLVRELEGARSAAAVSAVPAKAAASSPAIAAAPVSDAERARREAAELRALIVKTASQVERHVDVLRAALREDYLALSDFGSYREAIESSFEATARGVVESYDFRGEIEAVAGRLGGTESALETIRGEIRRGLVTDPETGETALGIAVAESLRFTGAEHTENGLVYHELAPGQTLGLYTATGWQFWLNGSKRGWFDSRDGMLHTAKLAVESSLRLGGDWLITTSGGFGLRYTGG